MRADASTPYSPYGYGVPPGDSFQTLDRRPSFENVPVIDTTYSHTSSGYGSPRDEDPTRLGLGLSPAAGGLSSYGIILPLAATIAFLLPLPVLRHQLSLPMNTLAGDRCTRVAMLDLRCLAVAPLV